MASIVPSSVDEHIAVVKAQAPKYFKGVSDLTFRRRLWLAMIQRYGGIQFNASSHSLVWTVEYSQPEVKQYGDSGDLEFNEHDALQQLTVDVRGYTATDRYTLKQKLMNKGPEQIDDLYKQKSKRLGKRMRQTLCRELYVDGYASGNGNRFIGIESALGDDGNTVAADLIAKPDDQYGGLDTDPGAYGGSWSSDLAAAKQPNATLANDWPRGRGTTEYDYISPLLVNYSSTSWPSGQTGWANNCEDAMRFARITQTNRGAMDENATAPFMHMLSADLYNDFLTFYSARNRQIVPHQESANLGFGDTMNFEGSAVHYEWDCAPATGYGIVPSMIELFVMHGQLIESVGPEWAIEKMGYLYLTYCFGNTRLSPKFLTKYKAYA